MYTEYAMKQPSANRKGVKKRLRILAMIMLFFITWAAFTYFQQMENLNDKFSQLSILEVKAANMQNTNEQFKHEIIRLQDPEYIEQRLRKDLQMTKEGETLFIQTR
jgi:cell division protein DivIC